MDKESWINKQEELLHGNILKGIKPKRKYLHFDNRIKKLSEETRSILFTPHKVLSHSFFPFLRYKKTTRRRKKTTNFSGFEPKDRYICYAAHLDTLIFSWYAHTLNDLYEQQLEKLGIGDSVLAYRSKNGSNVDHACVAFRNINDLGETNVICADISGFFDNLSHKLLKQAWLRTLQVESAGLTNLPDDHYKIFKIISKFAYIDLSDVYEALELPRERSEQKPLARLCSVVEFREKIADKGLIHTNPDKKGIPQGSSISAILANIYMTEFDSMLRAQMEAWGGKYYRYSDDILVIVPKTIDRSDVMGLLEGKISEVQLQMSSTKTEMFQFRNEKGILVARNSITGRKKNLNYLGMSFDGRRVLLKHGSLAGYQKKVVSAVRSALAYSFKKNKPVPRRKIYERYTKFGRQNFQSYVQRSIITLKKHGFATQSLKLQASDYFVHKTISRLKEVVKLQIVERQRRRMKRRGG